MNRPDPKLMFTDTHTYNRLYQKWQKNESDRVFKGKGKELCKRYLPECDFPVMLTRDELEIMLADAWYDGKED